MKYIVALTLLALGKKEFPCKIALLILVSNLFVPSQLPMVSQIYWGQLELILNKIGFQWSKRQTLYCFGFFSNIYHPKIKSI